MARRFEPIEPMTLGNMRENGVRSLDVFVRPELVRARKSSMGNELIRPIDPASARALEEASKAISKAIDAVVGAGRYGAAILGDLPHDLVAIMGDWVKHVRARRWIELSAKTEEILRQRGVENREKVSPSVAIPLIAAAINEDREA
jgi:hypothetical protein